MKYKIAAYTIATIHLLIIFTNLISIPCLMILQPFYIWMPLITFLVSPLVGGTYCTFNRLENYFRIKADLEPIGDRLWSFIDFITGNRLENT